MLSSYGFADSLFDHRDLDVEQKDHKRELFMSRKTKQKMRREQLKLGEDPAAYELCLECILEEPHNNESSSSCF